VPADDKYTYPGSSGVLRNLLDITDAEALDVATNAYVSIEWAALLREVIPDELDFTYLQFVHRRLFGKVFPWAGEVRDVELRAAGTSYAYCPSRLVQARLDEAFDALAAAEYLRGMDALEFAHALAQTWAELTRIHPFRDGNTRSQSFFVSRLAELAGHPIDWDQVNVDNLRAQRLAAAKGHPEALGFFVEHHLIDPPTF